MSEQRTKPRILALTGHPVEAAGARHRVIQFLPHLETAGFRVDHQAFFNSAEYAILYKRGHHAAKVGALVAGTFRRASWLAKLPRYDAVFMHVWLHPVSFPPFDMALSSSGVPVVYDLDDPYYAPNGSVADRLRDREFIVRLVRAAHCVIAGSEHIANFVRGHGAQVEIVSTAIDTERFTPRDFDRQRNPKPVIGWVGSPATAQFLEPIYPIIEKLARSHDFVFRVVGAGRRIPLSGVDCEWVDWKLENEVNNFRQLDIGLYPLLDGEFTRAKHGFKLNQYMATGIPTVASAIGMNTMLVEHGRNGFLANTSDEWYRALADLLANEGLRRQVGLAGRGFVEATASVNVCAPRISEILSRAVASRAR